MRNCAKEQSLAVAIKEYKSSIESQYYPWKSKCSWAKRWFVAVLLSILTIIYICTSAFLIWKSDKLGERAWLTGVVGISLLLTPVVFTALWYVYNFALGAFLMCCCRMSRQEIKAMSARDYWSVGFHWITRCAMVGWFLVLCVCVGYSVHQFIGRDDFDSHMASLACLSLAVTFVFVTLALKYSGCEAERSFRSFYQLFCCCGIDREEIEDITQLVRHTIEAKNLMLLQSLRHNWLSQMRDDAYFQILQGRDRNIFPPQCALDIVMSFLDEDHRRYMSSTVIDHRVGYGSFIRFGRDNIKCSRIAEYDQCSLFCLNAPCSCLCVAPALRDVTDLSKPGCTRLIPARTEFLRPLLNDDTVTDSGYYGEV